MKLNSEITLVEESQPNTKYTVRQGVFGMAVLLGGILVLSRWLRSWRRHRLREKIEKQQFEPDELDEDSFDIYGVEQNELYPPSAEVLIRNTEDILVHSERLGRFVRRLKQFLFGSEREAPTLPLPPPRN
jgi:hypothetical protein